MIRDMQQNIEEIKEDMIINDKYIGNNRNSLNILYGNIY